MKHFLIALALTLAASWPMVANPFHDPASADRAQTQQQTPRTVRSLQVKVLSTMLSGNPRAGIGEWGFAAIVEVDGQRILFDTGARPDTVLKNANELGVDLANVKDVILSHNHPDHTGGLMTLRREFAKTNPTALSRAHVGKGIFWNRPSNSGEANVLVRIKQEFEGAVGSSFDLDKGIDPLPLAR